MELSICLFSVKFFVTFTTGHENSSYEKYKKNTFQKSSPAKVVGKIIRKIAFLIVMRQNSNKNCFKTADPEIESLFFSLVAGAMDTRWRCLSYCDQNVKQTCPTLIPLLNRITLRIVNCA